MTSKLLVDYIEGRTSSGWTDSNYVLDQWRLNTNFTSNSATINSGWERPDHTGHGRIGTGMTESSGIFSFPSTGIWLVHYNLYAYFNAAARVEDMYIQKTVNNSDYATCAYHSFNAFGSGSYTHGGGDTSTIIDCTDVSNI